MTRPRDALGRPLAPGADPALTVPDAPDVTDLPDDDVWATALALLADGHPFHVHEVFEMRWRQAPEPERTAWRALAQWGAALTHEARGNPVGARRLAERALETLAGAEQVPGCVDRALVAASCRAIAYRAL